MKIYRSCFLLLSLFILNCFAAIAQKPIWQWANGDLLANSPKREYVVTDKSGNAYTAGRYLAKYSSNGVLVWRHDLYGGISATGRANVYGLQHDSNGNLFITGDFFGTVQFDTIPLTAFSLQDLYIAKFNANGAVQWVRRAGGIKKKSPPTMCCSIDDGATAIALDSVGNSYLLGASLNDTVHFDGLTFVPDSIAPLFVAKYNTLGVIQWVRELNNKRTFVGVAAGANGSYYLTGHDSNGKPTGSSSLFTEKYSASGLLEWRKWPDGQGAGIPIGIATDRQGSCYITGKINAETTFDTITLYVPANHSYGNMFLVKYNSLGQVMWAKQTNSTGSVSASAGANGEAVFIDSLQNVYVTGGFTNNVIFPGQQPIASSSLAYSDIFVAKYSANGNLFWVQKAGGNRSDQGQSISALPNGDSYITGKYSGPGCMFGSIFTPAPANSNSNFFLAKLSANPNGIYKTDVTQEFQLYPNPATFGVTISNPEFRNASVGISNVAGKKVLEEIYPSEGDLKISTESWPAGLYIVKVTVKGKVYNQKLMVQQ